MSTATEAYDIDGEQLSEREIVARGRAAGVAAANVRSRLHYGDRTWARLLRPPDRRPQRKKIFYGRRSGSRDSQGK